jgi:hypothetical protein
LYKSYWQSSTGVPILVAGARNIVLYTVMLFSAFCVIETIERANQVTGNTANALKWLSVIPIMNAYIFAIYCKVNPGKIFAAF